jgi:transcription elongation factor Elf1
MIIVGFRSYVRALAIVTLVCGRCGSTAAHRLIERTRKFTLFFIPLFPVSKSRVITCTACGQASAVTAEQAGQYVALATGAPSIGSMPPGAHR